MSCGKAIVTVPVSIGSVSTRIASGRAVKICSGRVIRSKKRLTGPEAVVDAHVRGDRMLELLEDRPLVASRVVIGREQEHRQVVDRRDGRARDHVGRAGPDRRRAGQRRQSQVGLGESDRRMHHRLLIARLVIRQLLSAFLECLAHAADVAVAKDAEHRRDQPTRLGRRARCTALAGTSRPPATWSGGCCLDE